MLQLKQTYRIAMFAQLGRKYAEKISPKNFARLWSMWPPFLAAGIKVQYINHDFTKIDVTMSLGIRNSNYVGTHFGGNIFAMTDPFYMIMIMNNIGRSYYVWDKSAEIQFLKPGRGILTAEFRLTVDDFEMIHDEIAKSEKGKFLLKKTVQVLDSEKDVVAQVDKVIYIKKKSDED